MAPASQAVVALVRSAALYSPVLTSAIIAPAAFVLALLCFVLLVAWRTPPWIIVLLGAAGGVGLTLLDMI